MKAERIKILRSMNSGVNYSDYQIAYSKISNKSEKIIPLSVLESYEEIQVREKGVTKTEAISKNNQKRILGDLVMKTNQYSFLTCVCGLKLKAPPEYQGKEVTCPRCGKRLMFNINNYTSVKMLNITKVKVL